MRTAEFLQQSTIFYIIVTLIFFPATVIASTNFSNCLLNVQNGTFGVGVDIGATDNSGNPVNVSDATAITYDLCVRACGSGQEPFMWTVFSQQFTIWLLPWLALISQLPFGTDDNGAKLFAVILTIGSPMLSAYTLASTVLSGRWIQKCFRSCEYPNSQKAMRILRNMTQVPFKINGKHLASLIVLPQNDDWFKELVKEMAHFDHTWSLSAATSIAWVTIAYVLTVSDSFSDDIGNIVQVNGQGVGSLWLWLLPIVIGWLQISPKCDEKRLNEAFDRVNNDKAYVFTDAGHVKLARDAGTGSWEAIKLTIKEADDDDGDLHKDQKRTEPIYNYANVFPWARNIVIYHEAVKCASDRMERRKPVDPEITWKTDEENGNKNKPHKTCREGTPTQVEAYCKPDKNQSINMNSQVASRILMASVLAGILQWGTAGGAIVIQFYTPTKGLGCRSTAYLLYTVLSTIVWMLLVSSSILTHYYDTHTSDVAGSTQSDSSAERGEAQSGNAPGDSIRLSSLGSRRSTSPESTQSQTPNSLKSSIMATLARAAKHICRVLGKSRRRSILARAAKRASIICRKLGKSIAALNVIVIMATCLLQFGSFFDRCFCDSSVFGLRGRAFNIITLEPSDIASLKSVWIAGLCLSAVPAVFYAVVIAINIPSKPDDN